MSVTEDVGIEMSEYDMKKDLNSVTNWNNSLEYLHLLLGLFFLSDAPLTWHRFRIVQLHCRNLAHATLNIIKLQHVGGNDQRGHSDHCTQTHVHCGTPQNLSIIKTQKFT